MDYFSKTSQTAEAYGFLDRVLKEGYRADVNIINYDELSLGAPELVWDLPAGGRRLIQRPVGLHRDPVSRSGDRGERGTNRGTAWAPGPRAPECPR